MGQIKINGDGSVEMKDVTFNPRNMDENMMTIALQVFGPFFERAFALEKISIDIEEQTEDVLYGFDDRQRISTGWQMEIRPWQGHRIHILNGRGDEFTL